MIQHNEKHTEKYLPVVNTDIQQGSKRVWFIVASAIHFLETAWRILLIFWFYENTSQCYPLCHISYIFTNWYCDILSDKFTVYGRKYVLPGAHVGHSQHCAAIFCCGCDFCKTCFNCTIGMWVIFDILNTWNFLFCYWTRNISEYISIAIVIIYKTFYVIFWYVF